MITQNVDMLHLKAGTRRVVELHGCYGRVRCLECGALSSRQELASRLEALNPGFADRVAGRGAIEVAPDADTTLTDTRDFVVADCRRCGGILKPDIVCFGENAAKEIVDQAFSLVDEGDVLLVAGSSLTVTSGLRFVRHAHRIGKPVVIVNRGVTGPTRSPTSRSTTTVRGFSRPRRIRVKHGEPPGVTGPKPGLPSVGERDPAPVRDRRRQCRSPHTGGSCPDGDTVFITH